jgi:demethylmenaquinone methyltransferase/2-methoxy-6-polyprenyl-1,4-benzoquinol methylase
LLGWIPRDLVKSGCLLDDIVVERQVAAEMAVDKSSNRVRQMFGAIAPRYDLMNHLLSMNVDRYWRWRTVRATKPTGTDPILDVCTGTGDLAFAFLKRTNGEAPVFGADFCREMLDIGRAKMARRTSREAMTFVEADAQCLPFVANTFQIVSVAFGLRNVADTDQGLREMTRVCRREGRVAVLEFSMPRKQPMRACYGWYFRHVLPRLGQWLARNDHQAYRYLPDSVGEFPEGPALVERMEAAGLTDVRLHPLTMGIATLYVGRKK